MGVSENTSVEEIESYCKLRLSNRTALQQTIVLLWRTCSLNAHTHTHTHTHRFVLLS